MIKTKNTKKMEEEVADWTCLACACARFLQLGVEELERQVLDN
jgi:hypothetical protein